MSISARTLLFLPLTLALVHCDSSSAFEECRDTSAEELVAGARRARCPSSVFREEDARSREVAGVVRHGNAAVPSAFVRVEAWAGLPSGATSAVATTLTDSVGVFSALRPVSLRYDLTTIFDHHVLVYRGVAGRYIEPTLHDPTRIGPTWSAPIDVLFDRPIPSGHAVAFFAGGEGTFGTSGDLESGLAIRVKDYSTRATLHAVEYELSGGLAAATAYGSAEVHATAGVSRLVKLTLEPISSFFEPTFTVTAPPGFEPDAVDLYFNFTWASGARLATVPIGTTRKLPIVPNASSTYRVVASHGGAISDTGEVLFDVWRPEATVALPSPPSLELPFEGGELAPGDELHASGEGVFEHVFEPQDGGAALRIVTAEYVTTLPALHSYGQSAQGAYLWTVHSYPTARFVEDLSGSLSRRYRPMAVSPARPIVLR